MTDSGVILFTSFIWRPTDCLSMRQQGALLPRKPLDDALGFNGECPKDRVGLFVPTTVYDQIIHVGSLLRFGCTDKHPDSTRILYAPGVLGAPRH